MLNYNSFLCHSIACSSTLNKDQRVFIALEIEKLRIFEKTRALEDQTLYINLILLYIELFSIYKYTIMKPRYAYSAGTIQYEYVNTQFFFKFRIRYSYDTLTKIYNKTYMYVEYLKKINTDYSSLLYYYKSYNFLKIIHVIKIIFFESFLINHITFSYVGISRETSLKEFSTQILSNVD